MAKVCKDSGCNRPVFGGGYCLAHQWRRTDGKSPKAIAKRARKKSVKNPGFGYDTQIEMFKDIFFKAQKPIFCPISGRDITDLMDGPIDQWIQMYAHILPKGKYPLFRLNPDNIAMVSPAVHHILDQGTIEDRERRMDWAWDWWDGKVAEMRLEYKLYLRENNI